VTGLAVLSLASGGIVPIIFGPFASNSALVV
jgi:hypothetical protein